MKIKTFKQSLRNENYDIPNVLEQIKPIAYNKEYPVIKNKTSFLNNFLQLIPVMTVFAICLLVVFNLEKPTVSENNPSECMPEPDQSSKENPSEQKINLYSTYITNFIGQSGKIKPEEASYSQYDNCYMFEIEVSGSSYLVVNETVFNYLLLYVRDNSSTTVINAVDEVKNKFSIPDEEAYAISDAYNYIKNNVYIK